MIEFYGKLSEKNKIESVKRHDAFLLKFTLIFVIPLLIACALFVLFNNNDKDTFYYCIGGAIVGVVIGLIIYLTPIPKDRLKKFNFAQKIVLVKDKDVAYRFSGSTEEFKAISDVKKVRDYGTCYYLMFDRLGDMSNAWICQKDLLVQGTIEEFEAMFEGKIIRKADKKAKRKKNPSDIND